MEGAHPDWSSEFERDRRRAERRRTVAIVVLIAGGFLLMSLTATLIAVAGLH